MKIPPLNARYINEGDVLLIESDYESISIKVKEENEELCSCLFELIVGRLQKMQKLEQRRRKRIKIVD